MNEEILMHENGLGLDLTVTILCINNLKEQFKVKLLPFFLLNGVCNAIDIKWNKAVVVVNPIQCKSIKVSQTLQM